MLELIDSTDRGLSLVMNFCVHFGSAMLDLWRLLRAAARPFVPEPYVSMPLVIELEDKALISDLSDADVISARSNSVEDRQTVVANVEAGIISANSILASRREKTRLRKKSLKAEHKAESDFISSVDERFNVLNGLLCEGIIDQQALLDLREAGDEADRHSCDMPIVI